jgi:glycosyltransferase involved in cell wall biosynthesis
MSLPISVVVPSYNRAHTLERALRSVMAQRATPAEVILVDDGSTDDTRQLLAQRYPQVRYRYQPRTGVSQARNLGIGMARSPWIALLDSDDAWLPDKLPTQWRALQQAPEARICHTEEIWIRNGVRVNAMKKHAKRGGDLFNDCLPLCVISPSSVLLRKDLLLRHGGFDPGLPACEDYDLWLKICARESVLFVTEPQIIKYGGHRDQLSRRHWGMDRFRIRSLRRLIARQPLSDIQARAALEVLRDKSRIFAQGAAKRGRGMRAAAYFRLAERASGALASSDPRASFAG